MTHNTDTDTLLESSNKRARLYYETENNSVNVPTTRKPKHRRGEGKKGRRKMREVEGCKRVGKGRTGKGNGRGEGEWKEGKTGRDRKG